MPEWLAIALLSLLGILLTTLGAVGGHILSARAQKRAAIVQAEANKSTAENKLIDQLQEELTRYRVANDIRSTTQDQRMNDLEGRNDRLMRERDLYRDHAHELRSHIWDGKPPPPPDWPEGLPR